ncbi:MAG: amino acid permease [Bacteroidota bacterium]|nr:amino acid permease [Bacteroidota bacterium]
MVKKEQNEYEKNPGPEDKLVDSYEISGENDKEKVKDIQEQTEEHEKRKAKKFGTFAGVFTPTLLTILGVIMFLRQGWVVGNAGFGGTILIILLSFLITGATGLSMSTFVTNIRIGKGGAFSLISQSLGLEAGGAIGIPLYLAQGLAVVMYIFGFREGYLWATEAWGLFPLPSLAIDLIVFAIIFGITLISTSLAFKVQYFILAIIITALLSVGFSVFVHPMDHTMVWWGNFPGSPEEGFPGTTFWVVFAIFFPASTGIMAGANMSGDLKNPRKSIPIGTLGAVGISLIVYLLLAYWLIRVAPEEELLRNYTVMIDRALWGPAVLGGLLSATFSSALASFVGAPRILEALGDHKIVPASEWFAKRTKRGEPRNASFFTAIIVLAAIMLRELNAIAPLVTMIFLLTYAVINLVVSVEQSLRLISFRPLMRVPKFVSVIGLFGCLFAMFIINPSFSLISVMLVIAIYYFLMKRKLTAPTGDVRSGLFNALAEWAAKQVTSIQGSSERAWKPNLLVPVEDPHRLRGVFEMIEQIASPIGSVKLMGIAPASEMEALGKKLVDSQEALKASGVFTYSTVLEGDVFPDAVKAGMQSLSGSFFRPNILFLELPKNKETHKALEDIIIEAERQKMGVALLVMHEIAGLGRRQRVNLWIPDQGPEWKMEMKLKDINLAVLLAYRIQNRWDAEFNVIVLVKDKSEKDKADNYISRLVDLARLPAKTFTLYAEESMQSYSKDGPIADLNIFPLPKKMDAEMLWQLRDATGSSCLFTRDSGEESALA